MLVVFFGLLSTGASLLEPLIYREAINDVAGLFVQQAQEDTKKQYGIDQEETDPIANFFENRSAPAVVDTTQQVQNAKPSATKTKHTKARQKQAHTTTSVAPRTPSQALNTLLWAVALLFLINLFGFIFWRIADNMNVRLSCHIEQKFIRSTFAHVLNLPLGFFSKRSSTAISKQIDQSESVSAVVNAFSQQVLPEIITLAGILIIMFSQNVILTLIAVSVLPVYLFIAWRSSIKLESGLSKYYDRWEEVSARIQDALRGIKTVKLSGAEVREEEALQKISDEAYKDYIDRARRGNKYVFWQEVLTHFASALVLAYGGYLTLQHKLTPGDVVMFVAYLDRLYGPIDSLSSMWVGLQQNIASIARAFRLLDNKEEVKQGEILKVKQGKVEFKNVRFGYVPGREVLKNLSFVIQPGKITALVGTSGAGKTTAVDLLMKLYQPESGEILIDDNNLGAYNSSVLRSQIGLVAADGAIFRGTLAENIRYKRPGATDAEVKAAATAAGMTGTLQRLPDGLQTLVGESGFGLSVGERQRLQIARVLVAQPRILILDEATANLDYATEAEVKKTINEVSREHTVIIIAHRYSMVHDADHIIVLSEGQILEQGSPADLIAAGGWFTDFAAAVTNDAEEENEQAEGEEEEE